jgi:hypothetical protein
VAAAVGSLLVWGTSTWHSRFSTSSRRRSPTSSSCS